MQNFSQIGRVVFEKNDNGQTDRPTTDKEKYNIRYIEMRMPKIQIQSTTHAT